MNWDSYVEKVAEILYERHTKNHWVVAVTLSPALAEHYRSHARAAVEEVGPLIAADALRGES